MWLDKEYARAYHKAYYVKHREQMLARQKARFEATPPERRRANNATQYRRSLEKSDFNHGTSGYRMHKCRCSICVAAHKEALSRVPPDKHARDKAAAVASGFANKPHGSVKTYNLGCRCLLCVTKNRTMVRKYTAKQRATEKYKATRRAYFKRIRSDPVARMVDFMRGRLRCVVASPDRKSISSRLPIGCSIDALRKHLEAQFLPGMTWDNYGTAWHVDHIMPVAAYNMEIPEQRSACFHYTNLQPLWDVINFEKHDSITFDTSYAIAMTPYPA